MGGGTAVKALGVGLSESQSRLLEACGGGEAVLWLVEWLLGLEAVGGRDYSSGLQLSQRS